MLTESRGREHDYPMRDPAMEEVKQPLKMKQYSRNKKRNSIRNSVVTIRWTTQQRKTASSNQSAAPTSCAMAIWRWRSDLSSILSSAIMEVGRVLF